MVKLRNTKTGEVIERLSVDAREIIDTNKGLWVLNSDPIVKPVAPAPETSQKPAAAPEANKPATDK